jgi:hypothetical protein
LNGKCNFDGPEKSESFLCIFTALKKVEKIISTDLPKPCEICGFEIIQFFTGLFIFVLINGQPPPLSPGKSLYKGCAVVNPQKIGC